MTESRGHEPDTPQEGLSTGLSSDETFASDDDQEVTGADAPAEAGKDSEDE
jgi:hypothetical protein